MGVYIPTMKKPTSCLRCEIRNGLFCPLTYKFIGEKDMKGCPLVGVPQPRGRLIDASEEITVQMYDDQHEDFYQVKMTINALLSQSWIDAKAPTVIPAEEGET